MVKNKSAEYLGQTFGDLTVIEYIPSSKENTVNKVVCKCICENVTTERAYEVKNGTVKSCGCDGSRGKKGRKPKIEYVGKQFGELTVIRYIPGKKGVPTKLECLCSCGKTKIATAHAVKSGITVSCGCKQNRRHNTSIAPNKRSGTKGVMWDAANRKWRVYVNFNQRQAYLGLYEDVNEAKRVREIAELIVSQCSNFLPEEKQTPKHDIERFMTVREAAYRWGLKVPALREKMNVFRRPQVREEIDVGLVKYFKAPDAKQGDWLLSVDAMEKWYGPEPEE